MGDIQTCAAEGCENRRKSGYIYCNGHYLRFRRTGNLGTKPVKMRTGNCSIEGCENLSAARGWCTKHYSAFRRLGDPLASIARRRPNPDVPLLANDLCSAEGCQRARDCGKLCNMHYQRQRRTGTLADPTGQGRRSGSRKPNEQGYLRYNINGKVQHEHRYVMEQVIGRPLRPEETVHHINGVRDDNRPENLELWSGRHGKGQRVTDHIAFAVDTLKLYAPHLLAEA